MDNEGIQIRVSDLLYGVYKHRILIAAMTIAGLMIGFLLSGVSYLRGDMSREYVVSSSIALNTRVGNGHYSSSSLYPTNSDFYLAEDMVTAAVYVLQSEKTLNAAINENMLTGISNRDIANNLSVSQYEDTQILELVLYWRDGEEGTAVLNAINSVAPSILQETLDLGGISVINAPSAHYLVGGSLNAALCGGLALLGLIGGIGIAVLELLLHPTLLNTRDLETKYGLEVLGEVPSNDAYFRQNNSLLVRNNSYLDITESFSSISHILNNLVGSKEKHPCIYVTSPTRNEGKTMAVANLAIQLSDNEKKVLLIDFDLRNPHLGNLFLNKVEYDHSLNALYRGDINETEAITTLTGYLDILPAVLERNTIPLDSTIFGLVKKLAQNYDYVLMDTAPVGVAANTLSLNEIATAALLVVRHDTASVQEIRDTLDRMDKSGVRLLGCIVNDVHSSELGMRRTQRTARQRKNSKSDRGAMAMMAADESKYAPVQSPINMAMDAEEQLAASQANALDADATADDFTAMLFKLYDGKASDQEDFSEESPAKAEPTPEPEASPADEEVSNEPEAKSSTQSVTAPEASESSERSAGTVNKLFYKKAKH